MTGSTIMVEIFSNRIEISNPGQPCVPPERFIDGYGCRNIALADWMRRFGFCEEKGSGIDKVMRLVEEYHLPPPEIRFDDTRTTFILQGPREFADMWSSERIRACYQHCCLKYVSGVLMTNQTLRERFKLTEKQSSHASNVIAATQAAGLIRIHTAVTGSSRYARYLPFWAYGLFQSKPPFTLVRSASVRFVDGFLFQSKPRELHEPQPPQDSDHRHHDRAE